MHFTGLHMSHDLQHPIYFRVELVDVLLERDI